MPVHAGASFFFTWREDPSVGDGRSSIWIDAAIPLYFKYYGSKAPTINREWLERASQRNDRVHRRLQHRV